MGEVRHSRRGRPRRDAGADELRDGAARASSSRGGEGELGHGAAGQPLARGGRGRAQVRTFRVSNPCPLYLWQPRNQRELGLETSSIVDNELEELFELSLRMFDTRLPPGVTVLSPFAEDSSLTKVGVEAITATSTKKGDLILGEIQSQIKNKGITVDVKANSASNVITTITADEYAAPGLKTIFSFAVPDQKSGKVELQYLHDYAGINASIGLTANPVVNLPAAFGNSALAVGADVSLDTATKNLTKYNAGLSYTNKDLIASLNL
ncbi:hypothetical protein ACQ4PT_005707 [Festuca glaucescens]